jgi:hypothetical protein
MSRREGSAETVSIVRLACSNGVPRYSLAIAIVVGTILNLINQGDVLIQGGEIDFVKLGLTYCVPYLVSTYGSVMAQRRMLRAGLGKTTDAPAG